MSFADYQNAVYLNGMAAGQRPTLPVGAAELQAAAEAAMTPQAVGYVSGSAGAEETAQANRAAFRRWEIVPRQLRAVPASRELGVSLLGRPLAAPVLLAPVGVLEIVHPDADLAVARAAAAVGIPMVTSTAASHRLEDVRTALGETDGWFQLYWPRDPELAASLVGRAQAAGYRAVVVTVDTWQLGWRPRDLAQGFLPFLAGQGLANYFSDPVFRAGLARTPEEDLTAAVVHFVGLFTNPDLTFADLGWLRGQTDLPIVVKGLQHPDDVRAAIDAGAAAVVCSNHGGRQVDGAVGSLDCLPDLVAAAGTTPVLFDSGIRTGADALKALALGARAVLLGRPWVWGLALGGQAGVEAVLRGFLAELDLTLGLSGHPSVGDLGPGSLRRLP